MIEVKRDDFFVESIKNPIEYGTYYKINQKYGIGFQWTSEVHHDFVITVTDIRFNHGWRTYWAWICTCSLY